MNKTRVEVSVQWFAVRIIISVFFTLKVPRCSRFFSESISYSGVIYVRIRSLSATLEEEDYYSIQCPQSIRPVLVISDNLPSLLWGESV